MLQLIHLIVKIIFYQPNYQTYVHLVSYKLRNTNKILIVEVA